jgi:hypothetical protein
MLSEAGALPLAPEKVLYLLTYGFADHLTDLEQPR